MKLPENDTDETSPNETQCKLCMEPILVGAAVCRHCQRHQSNFVRHFPNIGVIVSIGLLLIAGVQLFQAFQERKTTIEAATIAKKASEVAKSTQKSATLFIKGLKVLKNNTKNELASASELAKRALVDINSVEQDVKKAANILEQTTDIAKQAKQKGEVTVRELQALETKIKEDLALASSLANAALSDAKNAKQDIEITRENINLERIEELTRLLKELETQKRDFDNITRERESRYWRTKNHSSEERRVFDNFTARSRRQGNAMVEKYERIKEELAMRKKQINKEFTQ